MSETLLFRQGCRGEEYGESGADTDLGFDVQGAAGLADEALHNVQSQPAPWRESLVVK